MGRSGGRRGSLFLQLLLLLPLLLLLLLLLDSANGAAAATRSRAGAGSTDATPAAKSPKPSKPSKPPKPTHAAAPGKQHAAASTTSGSARRPEPYDARVARLLELERSSPLIHFTGATLASLADVRDGARNYSIILMLSALSPRHGCAACKYAMPAASACAASTAGLVGRASCCCCCCTIHPRRRSSPCAKMAICTAHREPLLRPARRHRQSSPSPSSRSSLLRVSSSVSTFTVVAVGTGCHDRLHYRCLVLRLPVPSSWPVSGSLGAGAGCCNAVWPLSATSGPTQGGGRRLCGHRALLGGVSEADK